MPRQRMFRNIRRPCPPLNRWGGAPYHGLWLRARSVRMPGLILHSDMAGQASPMAQELGPPPLLLTRAPPATPWSRVQLQPQTLLPAPQRAGSAPPASLTDRDRCRLLAGTIQQIVNDFYEVDADLRDIVSAVKLQQTKTEFRRKASTHLVCTM